MYLTKIRKPFKHAYIVFFHTYIFIPVYVMMQNETPNPPNYTNLNPTQPDINQISSIPSITNTNNLVNSNNTNNNLKRKAEQAIETIEGTASNEEIQTKIDTIHPNSQSVDSNSQAIQKYLRILEEKNQYIKALEKSNEEIKSRVSCVVCGDLPKNSQLWQCTNTHLLCSGCLQQIFITQRPSKCPICRVPLNKDNAIRTRVLEDILTQTLVKCANVGCEQTLLYENLLQHSQGSCEYRPVKCPGASFGVCPWEGSMQQFQIQHSHVCGFTKLEKKCFDSLLACWNSKNTELKNYAAQIASQSLELTRLGTEVVRKHTELLVLTQEQKNYEYEIQLYTARFEALEAQLLNNSSNQQRPQQLQTLKCILEFLCAPATAFLLHDVLFEGNNCNDSRNNNNGQNNNNVVQNNAIQNNNGVLNDSNR